MDERKPIERQCTAKSRSKKRCLRTAIPGGTVCVMHGGRAPQVKRSAEERLKALVHPAITVFEERLLDAQQPAIQVAVARDILDRTGFGGKTKLQLTGADDGPVKFDLSGLNDDEFAVITGVMARVRVGRRG